MLCQKLLDLPLFSFILYTQEWPIGENRGEEGSTTFEYLKN